jgi:outer membrane protein assembly factor BamB
MANSTPRESVPRLWLAVFALCTAAAFWQAHELDVASTTAGPNRRLVIAVAAPALEPSPNFLDIGLYKYPKQAGMVVGITPQTLVILRNDDSIYAVNGDGEKAWSFTDTHREHGGFHSTGAILLGDKVYAFCANGYQHVLNMAGKEERVASVGSNLTPRAWLSNGNLLLEEPPNHGNVSVIVIKPSGEIVRKEELGPLLNYAFRLGGGEHGPFYYLTASEPGKANGKAVLTAIGGDGKKSWQKELSGAPSPSYVSGDGVFYHCCDPGFSAIGSNGKLLWKTNFLAPQSTWNCTSSIAGEWKDEIFFQRCTEWIALAKKDGRPRTIPLPFKIRPDLILSGQLMTDGSLVVMGDYLYRIDSNGKLIWRFAPDLRGDQFHADLRAIGMAKNGDVFAISNLSEIYCITPVGKKRWVFRNAFIGGHEQVISDIPGLLIVGSGGGVGTFALKFAAHEGVEEAAQ